MREMRRPKCLFVHIINLREKQRWWRVTPDMFRSSTIFLTPVDPFSIFEIERGEKRSRSVEMSTDTYTYSHMKVGGSKNLSCLRFQRLSPIVYGISGNCRRLGCWGSERRRRTFSSGRDNHGKEKRTREPGSINGAQRKETISTWRRCQRPFAPARCNPRE